ncbi:MAG: M4 family metallopeptidase [Lewinellaceae bacterium]|nr:M4 family metallopeptidase [Lewinellaceae bacterium]
MKQTFISFLAIVLTITCSFGQMKPALQPVDPAHRHTPADLAPVTPLLPGIPPAAAPFPSDGKFSSLPVLPKPVQGQPRLQAYLSPETGTPYQIRGDFETDPQKALKDQQSDYLEAVRSVLRLDVPTEELVISRVDTEPNGQVHIRYQQLWKGVPVYGAEVVLHKNAKAYYLFNGRYFPSPRLADVTPVLTAEQAAEKALGHVAGFETVKKLSPDEARISGGAQTQTTLVIYHPDRKPNAARLAWHVTVIPNITARYSYFIDAQHGDVLGYHSELCKLTGFLPEAHHSCAPPSKPEEGANAGSGAAPPPDGPATANAQDLLGQTRLINTYCKNNVYYLIDASQAMFNNTQSSFPDDPVGVIWTIDAQNTSPENANFSLKHITSATNAWNNPKAVSAHYHGEKAYDYFKGTFNRESINGQGGNILSLINVVESDNTQMDNAFWNGFAMFYGNGNQAFVAPLAKALDVSGHEMSHGVIQSTANLEYMGESGALNESFADVFGAMIDRNDWQMGEDVVNTNIFPSGALRDLSNPHNGGNNLNDPGWQPAHYSERYTGSQDNGGVHINSGIVNRAYYLFANSIGKDKAEQVYYRALDKYLVKSSQFIDCRIAVIQAATDLYGAAEVNAAKAAFDAVGIGEGSGTNSQTDIATNPGDDYILMTDAGFSALYIFTPDGQEIANPLTTLAPLSRPSITDDGTVVVYIADDNTMRGIILDWGTGQTDEFVMQNEPIWRNVAISKDGERLAALTTDNDNFIWIYDFGLQQWQEFELYNPTTGQGGPTTGDVHYADVLEWDFSSQWVLYDAFNSLHTATGNDIEYWDIGFIQVSNGNNFSDGHIEKLFSGLQEGISIGNPTFSKNSDYIIAFDYLDEYYNEYYLLGANIESGEVGTIFQNADLSWPNYSVDDNRMVFDAESAGTPVLAFINLASDKIHSTGTASVFVNQGRSGVWFANGTRPLSTDEPVGEMKILLFPNPVERTLNLEFYAETGGEGQLELFDSMGRQLGAQSISTTAGVNKYQWDVGNLPAGPYFVRLRTATAQVILKAMKK